MPRRAAMFCGYAGRKPANRPAATALATALLDRLGIAWGGTTADGRLTVLPVYCLGLCACGPAALLDGEPIGELDNAKLAEIAA